MKINKQSIRFILALLGVAFSMTWFVMLLFVTPPEINRDVVSAFSGALIAICLKEVYGFWFGSSQGSDDKNGVINSTNPT